MIAGLSNKELLLSAYRLRGSELAFAGALKAAAAEFRAVSSRLQALGRNGPGYILPMCAELEQSPDEQIHGHGGVGRFHFRDTRLA